MSVSNSAKLSPDLVAQTSVCGFPLVSSQTEVCATSRSLTDGLRRRFARERRRRKVGRAYDMALEIARVLPRGSQVLDVGCGNGFIAHHLNALLGQRVLGIDIMQTTEAPINYRRYDGKHFPIEDNSMYSVLLCYVLHHSQDVRAILSEIRRVLRDDGVAIIYEDVPQTWWDKAVCWIHNRQWQNRTGACTFRMESEWCDLFASFGFAVSRNRGLSRWRNLTHPVRRSLYLLRPVDQPVAAVADRRRTRIDKSRNVRAELRLN